MSRPLLHLPEAVLPLHHDLDRIVVGAVLDARNLIFKKDGRTDDIHRRSVAVIPAEDIVDAFGRDSAARVEGVLSGIRQECPSGHKWHCFNRFRIKVTAQEHRLRRVAKIRIEPAVNCLHLFFSQPLRKAQMRRSEDTVSRFQDRNAANFFLFTRRGISETIPYHIR